MPVMRCVLLMASFVIWIIGFGGDGFCGPIFFLDGALSLSHIAWMIPDPNTRMWLGVVGGLGCFLMGFGIGRG